MKTKVTLTTLYKMKQAGDKITALTAYDYPFAARVDAAGVDMILVGDSAAMVVQGRTTTLPITMDEMIYHTSLVSRGVQRAMVVGDMPFMAYQADPREAVRNAGRFLKEAGATAIKLEGGAAVCDVIKAVGDAGIPVQAHIGLTPQSVHQMGGYKVQRDEDRLMSDALKVQEAGAFSVVLEGIPAGISETITKELRIPTIGIGAGPACDGQILVLHDMLGLNTGHLPKFVKKYAELATAADTAISRFVSDVKGGAFPADEHCY
ncbi:MAG: 3-methyl-2-oxobutanoate hydroxymethyltransferase [Deltaproteobacteria bacterium]|nr:MAG: 3-methyl-2-oxobutanoate hydroxymethyltransferase [Deltaproteobacteria bacterium]